MAFEFLGRRVAVLDDELDLLARRDDEFGRLETMVLDHDRERVVGSQGGRDRKGCEEGKQGNADHRVFWLQGLSMQMIMITIHVRKSLSSDGVAPIGAESPPSRNKWLDNVEIVAAEKIGIEPTIYGRNLEDLVSCMLKREAKETELKLSQQVAQVNN